MTVNAMRQYYRIRGLAAALVMLPLLLGHIQCQEDGPPCTLPFFESSGECVVQCPALHVGNHDTVQCEPLSADFRVAINATRFYASIYTNTPPGTPVIYFAFIINNTYFQHPFFYNIRLLGDESILELDGGGNQDGRITFGDPMFDPVTNPVIAIEREIIYNDTRGEMPPQSNELYTIQVEVSPNPLSMNVALETRTADVEVMISEPDPPDVTVDGETEAAVSYTEGSSGLPIAPNATVSDDDSANLAAGNISLNSSDFLNTDFLISTNSHPDISVLYNEATGVMTLTGLAPPSAYELLLRGVQFFSLDNPFLDTDGLPEFNLTRLVSITVSDGELTSQPLYTCISFIPVNDPLQVILDPMTLILAHNSSNLSVTPSINITDSDSRELCFLSVTLTGTVDGDFLTDGVTSGTTLGYSFISILEVTLTNITYVNPIALRTPGIRNLTILACDVCNSCVNTILFIDVAPVPLPLIAFSGSNQSGVSYVEGSPGIQVAPDATVSYNNTAPLTGATIRLHSPKLETDTLLSINNLPDVTADYSVETGVMTLTGVASTSAYEYVIGGIQFHSDDNPVLGIEGQPDTDLNRTVSLTVFNGEIIGQPAYVFISFIPVNDPPQFNLDPMTLILAHNSSNLSIAPSINITDSDSRELCFLSVTLTGNVDGDYLTDGVTTGTTLTNSFISILEVTLTNITYVNPIALRTPGIRNLTILACDVCNSCVNRILFIDVAPVPVPLIAFSGSNQSDVSYVEGSPGIAVAPDATVSYNNTAPLTGATIRLHSPKLETDTLLSINNLPDVTADYRMETGVMMLTGIASTSAYEHVIRGIRFHSEDNPVLDIEGQPDTDLNRTVSLTVFNGEIIGQPAHVFIFFTPVNDPPQIMVNETSLVFTHNSSLLSVAPSARLIDSDSRELCSMVVTLTSTVDGDYLTDGDRNGTNLTYIRSGSLSNHEAILSTITYVNPAARTTPGTRNVTITACDCTTSVSETVTIEVPPQPHFCQTEQSVPLYSGSTLTFTWNATEAGTNRTQECPCIGLVGAPPSDGMVVRECILSPDGTVQWDPVNFSSCGLSQSALELCQAMQVVDERVVSEIVASVTADPERLDAPVITLTSIIIEELTEAAVEDPEVLENYLDTVDNVMEADPDAALQSQLRSNSSTRILESFQTVLGSAPLPANSTFVQDNFVSFLEDMLPAQQSVTFDFGPVEDILMSSSRVIRMQPLDNATAFVQIQNLTCAASSESLRVHYTAFLRDTFFLTNETCIEEAIGSLIVAVGVNMTNYSSDCVNLFLHFQKNEEACNGSLESPPVGQCAIFDLGDGARWSTDNCRVSRDDEGITQCDCAQLGHFGLLFDLTPGESLAPLVLHVISYIGAILSIISLVAVVATYAASYCVKTGKRKMKSNENVIILINLSIALIGLYVVFLIGGHVTSVPTLCAVVSALLQYFLLVYFGWTAVEAVLLFRKLVTVFASEIEHFAIKAAIVVWLAPLVVVAISVGPGHEYYTNPFFCRPLSYPFWFGLILPFVIIYVFNWIVFVIIVVRLLLQIVHRVSKEEIKVQSHKSAVYKEIKKHLMIPVILSIIFGLGWGFGLAATSSETPEVTFAFQLIFSLFVGSQGLLIFLLYVVKPENTRELWKRVFLRCSKRMRKYQIMDTSSASKKPLHISSDTAPLTESSVANTLPRGTLPRAEQSMEIVANTSILSIQDTPSHNSLGVVEVKNTTANNLRNSPKKQQLMQDTPSRHTKEFGVVKTKSSTATTPKGAPPQQSMQVIPSRHANKQASLGVAKTKSSTPPKGTPPKPQTTQVTPSRHANKQASLGVAKTKSSTPPKGTPPKPQTAQVTPSRHAKMDKNGVALGIANPEHHLTPEDKITVV